MRDLRSLPEAVLERLGADPIPGVDIVRTFRGRQTRMEERLGRFEVRATEDGAPILEGYASSSDVFYDVYGGPELGGFRERIVRGAFQPAIDRGDDVRLLVNHDGLPLARTKSGTLELSEDAIGLHMVTPRGIDMANPLAQEIVSVMQRGDADQMSFAFMVARDGKGWMQEWNSDYTERSIFGLDLFDVSVVTYPANPATGAIVRSDEDEKPKKKLEVKFTIDGKSLANAGRPVLGITHGGELIVPQRSDGQIYPLLTPTVTEQKGRPLALAKALAEAHRISA